MTLQATQISQARGERTLFSDLGFVLRAGEALWVQGANGSGKTSLLRVLCGLAMPLHGEVTWQGKPILREREAYFQNVAYFGHASGVKDELSAWENLVFAAALAGQPCSRESALEALARLGLTAAAQLPARALSQGQRRRVALARLFVEPMRPLLILDEPFTALDAGGIDTVRELLDRHLARQGMVVYTTHQPISLAAQRLQTLELNDDAVPCATR